MITEEIKNGIIMKATAGFYYVKGPGGNIMECRARGVFRKQKITPLVGDKVTVTFDGESGTVTEIYKRKNFLLRPPVANIDKLIIVASVDEPKPNLYIIDKLTAQAYNQEITPVVVFSKADLGDFEKYAEIYNNAGIKSFGVSSKTGQGIDEFKKIFENSLCALTGNTGVGKSSILNSLAPELSLATAHISSKLGRGRHTTRTVELYELFGGLIADTPGFSALEFEGSELIVLDIQYRQVRAIRQIERRQFLRRTIHCYQLGTARKIDLTQRISTIADNFGNFRIVRKIERNNS